MLRRPLLVIDHVLTVDITGLVRKLVGGIQKYRLLWQALPSLFPSFALFSLRPPPPLLTPATDAAYAANCEHCRETGHQPTQC